MTLLESVRSVFRSAGPEAQAASTPHRSSIDELIRWLQTGRTGQRTTDPPQHSQHKCCPDDIQ